jgi:superoxide dismutase, Cu-Zn family
MRIANTALVIAIAAAAAGCTGMQTAGVRASATLEPRSGSQVSGTVSFSEQAGAVKAHVELAGLAPNSVHGFHVHDKGDCSAADAASAGGHFNPGGTLHGSVTAAVHHAGDLPSLNADGSGHVRTDLVLGGVTLSPGPTSILGRSVIVHLNPDDYTSQPAGNSGPKVACGVIVAK